MNTKIVRLGEGNKDQEALREAGEILKAGGLVAFPTETVYGLGGDALNPDSSRKIYAAKGRPSDNPLIVHIYRTEDLYQVARKVPKEALQLAEAFWPGPLTMILPKSDLIPLETTGGLDTVAVRLPSHPGARSMIEYAGGFVAAPSANLSGRPSPTTAKYVVEDMNGRIEMILDGGEVGIGLESTIVDLTVNPPQILRPGFITSDMLKEVLGSVENDATLFTTASGQAPRAPGMKYRHYAPKGNLVIVQGENEQVVSYVNEKLLEAKSAGKKTGVIAASDTADRYEGDVIKTIGDRRDEEVIARRLYGILREFDDENVEQIYSESFGGEEDGHGGLGQAIMNRLLKAAGHQVIRVN
ncbi:MAG: threonylcarbamoyl-AMP synthase [Lachnospiraceae bacterium]|jgi:L-threonylcarbamoyladenylate synthase|nr:threonylcarbamoyl-AMP synthase [Lachnospiraceae bacterium]